MGIFDWLFKSSKQPSIEHYYFGELEFHHYKNTGAKSWSGEIELNCLSRPVGIHLAADENGPTETQVEFCKGLFEDLEKLYDKCSASLVECYQNWSDSTETPLLREKFIFYGLGIPADGNELNDWEASFEMPFDPAGHTISVYFKNGQDVGCSIDG